jgi:type IV pilus assembly protein PilA
MNAKFKYRSGCRGADRSIIPNGSRRQANGFTLMELLIVIAIILILMLMAIPTIGSLKKKANETSAINSIQVIGSAELQYESTFPSNGFSCSLTALGGDPNSGAPSATSAQVLQNDLASGFKSGYIFTVGNCTKVTVNSTDRFTGYQITAVPQTVGKTGDRGFCTDQFGTIKFDPAGGTNCTQTLGQ